MKGLVEDTHEQNVFLTVKHHSIVEQSKKPQPGFEAIEVTNPRSGEQITKYIKRYRSVEALVTKIEWYDTGDRYDARYMGWKLYLNAAGTACVLDLPFNSKAANRFMKCAENVVWSEPVEFSVWEDKEGSTAFVMRQDGEVVRQKYTRDNPGKCPPPTQSRSGKWNYDAQTDFLYERITGVVIPAVEAAANPEGAPRQAPVYAAAVAAPAGDSFGLREGAGSDEMEDDDIPF